MASRTPVTTASSDSEVPDIWLEVMTSADGDRVDFLVRPRTGDDSGDAAPGDTGAYRVCHVDGSIDELPTLRAVAESLGDPERSDDVVTEDVGPGPD